MCPMIGHLLLLREVALTRVYDTQNRLRQIRALTTLCPHRPLTCTGS
jgi:hypothetical protein